MRYCIKIYQHFEDVLKKMAKTDEIYLKAMGFWFIK